MLPKGWKRGWMRIRRLIRMTMDNTLFAEFAGSEKFVELATLALDHGFNSIADGGGPLVPFAVTLGESAQTEVFRFVTDELSEGVARAMAFVDGKSRELRVYAIAWDGYITIDDAKHDAIFVEAGVSSQREALLLCQPYQQVRRGLLRKMRCEKSGEPMLVGRAPSRLTAVGS